MGLQTPRKPSQKFRVKIACLTTQLLVIFQTISGSVYAADPPSSLTEILVQPVIDVQVPAPLSGAVTKMHVRQGDVAEAGKTIANLDPQDAEIAVQHAQTEYKIKQLEADDKSQILLAKNQLEKEKQSANRYKLDLEIAERLATNDLRIQATEKATGVAKNELKRAQQSKREFDESVSQSKLEGLQLVVEKAKLDALQAAFEHSIEELRAASAKAASQHQQLSVEAAVVSLEKAKNQREVIRLQAKLQQTQVQQSILFLKRHTVLAPVEGMVVESYVQAGEWIEKGQPLLRMISLNPLRARGFVPIDNKPFQLRNKRVVVEVIVDGQVIEQPGKIIFVDSEIDPNNREVRVWAEFENSEGRIRPGMQGKMRLFSTQRPESSAE